MVGQWIGRFLCDIAAVLPLGVVAFLGIALSWRHRSAHPVPAWMVIAGCALLMLTELVQKGAYLLMDVADLHVAYLYSALYLLHSVGVLVAMLLVLVAIPLQRTAPAQGALWD